MKHWTEYDPDTGVRTVITIGMNPKLFQWIEQTRGDKSRSRYVRDVLTEAMKNA